MRPDLQAAQMGVVAADHRVGAALANRFPTLTLGIQEIGFSAPTPTGLFDNLIWSFLASVTQTVFDGGRRGAQIAQARAVLEERVHAYGQTMLNAIFEVESAVIREKHQQRNLVYLTTQLEQARVTLKQTRSRYAQGLTDYLPCAHGHPKRSAGRNCTPDGSTKPCSRTGSLYRALGGTWTESLLTTEQAAMTTDPKTANN